MEAFFGAGELQSVGWRELRGQDTLAADEGSAKMARPAAEAMFMAALVFSVLLLPLSLIIAIYAAHPSPGLGFGDRILDSVFARL